MSQVATTTRSKISPMPHDQRRSWRTASRSSPASTRPACADRSSALEHGAGEEGSAEKAQRQPDPGLTEVPRVGVDNHPDPEAEDGDHRRSEDQRTDDAETEDEAGDRVALAAPSGNERTDGVQRTLIGYVRQRVLADDGPADSPPMSAGSANALSHCSRAASATTPPNRRPESKEHDPAVSRTPEPSSKRCGKTRKSNPPEA